MGEHGHMEVRAALPGDVDVLHQLRLEFVAEHGGLTPGDLGPEFGEATRRFLGAGLEDGSVVAWLAEVAHEPVGTVALVLQAVPPRPSDLRTVEALVVDMYVRPGHRRSGFGRRLLEVCLASGPELGVRRFNLYSTEVGRQLYLASGFTVRGDWMIRPVPPD